MLRAMGLERFGIAVGGGGMIVSPANGLFRRFEQLGSGAEERAVVQAVVVPNHLVAGRSIGIRTRDKENVARWRDGAR